MLGFMTRCAEADLDPAGTADIEAEDGVPELEDEAYDDIEVDPDLVRTDD